MSYENQICELYFLLHRNNIHEIGSRLTLLLRSLKAKTGATSINDICYLKTLYCLIGHVRDIYFGHGERDLAYMMIFVWYKFYPVLAIYAFHQFVKNKNGMPYGCWNDIKYFCKFIARISDRGMDDPLIDIAVSCANRQLLSDLGIVNGRVSNVCKWIPRENKIEWLFEKLVVDWFSCHDLLHNNCSFSHLKKMYRQMIVGICKRSGDGKPTIKNIFQSVNTNCIMNDTYETSNSGCSYFHDNVFIGTYIKTAVSIIDGCKKGVGIDAEFDTCCEAIWLNKMWCQMMASFFDNTCSGGIPLIDISADISNESLYHAIGFACLIAIKSGLFRILLVSNTPLWIEFTYSDSICSIVHKIWSFCKFRSSSQFTFSFQFLMDAFYQTTICTSIQLFIFSQRFLFDWSQLVQRLGNKCSFVFWNIGEDVCQIKKDFHMDDHKKILFVSGCNVALFAKFCNDVRVTDGSHDFLLAALHSDRYKSLADYFDSQTSSASPSIVSGTSSSS